MTDTKELELKLREQELQGQKAEMVKKEIQSAVEALERDMFDTFMKSSVHDSEGHKTIRMYGQVLKDIQDRINLSIRKGEGASRKLIKIKQSSILRKVI